jgi:hypothetical protein
MAYAKAFLEEKNTETRGIHFQLRHTFLEKKISKYQDKNH